MKNRIIFPLGLLFLLVITTAQAQDKKAPCDTESKISVITEDDYPNFLNIADLKKYSNIIYNGVTVNPKKGNEYLLEGYGKNKSLEARYGKDGKLISARLVKKNHPLPNAIYRYLVSDSYKDWSMIGNTTYVKDFDAMSTEYEVQIKQGSLKQTLYFDRAGNPIQRLALK